MAEKKKAPAKKKAVASGRGKTKPVKKPLPKVDNIASGRGKTKPAKKKGTKKLA